LDRYCCGKCGTAEVPSCVCAVGGREIGCLKFRVLSSREHVERVEYGGFDFNAETQGRGGRRDEKEEIGKCESMKATNNQFNAIAQTSNSKL